MFYYPVPRRVVYPETEKKIINWNKLKKKGGGEVVERNHPLTGS